VYDFEGIEEIVIVHIRSWIWECKGKNWYSPRKIIRTINLSTMM